MKQGVFLVKVIPQMTPTKNDVSGKCKSYGVCTGTINNCVTAKTFWQKNAFLYIILQTVFTFWGFLHLFALQWRTDVPYGTAVGTIATVATQNCQQYQNGAHGNAVRRRQQSVNFVVYVVAGKTAPQHKTQLQNSVVTQSGHPRGLRKAQQQNISHQRQHHKHRRIPAVMSVYKGNEQRQKKSTRYATATAETANMSHREFSKPL